MYRPEEIYFEELAHTIVGLASPKSIGLEIQVSIGVAVLNLNSVVPSSRLKTQAGFLLRSYSRIPSSPGNLFLLLIEWGPPTLLRVIFT